MRGVASGADASANAVPSSTAGRGNIGSQNTRTADAARFEQILGRQGNVLSRVSESPQHPREQGSPELSHYNRTPISHGSSMSECGSSSGSEQGSPSIRETDDYDRSQFHELETQHSDLFQGGGVTHVTSFAELPTSNIEHGHMGETHIRVVPPHGDGAVGTVGLATCIAVVGKGQDAHGNTVLGIHHYTGSDHTGNPLSPGEAMADVNSKMAQAGAQKPSFSLFGGQMAPLDSESNTLNIEEEFLYQRGRYDMTAVRLHPTSVAVDQNGDKIGFSALDVVANRDNTFISHNKLYDPT